MELPSNIELPSAADVHDDAARVAELVKHFEEWKDWENQAKVFEMLERIDHMHRACIWRLYELTLELGGKGLVDRLQLDPVIKTLFILYDLLPPEPTEPTEARES